MLLERAHHQEFIVLAVVTATLYSYPSVVYEIAIVFLPKKKKLGFHKCTYVLMLKSLLQK